jgi:tRNA-specific 2-thiouridylase
LAAGEPVWLDAAAAAGAQAGQAVACAVQIRAHGQAVGCALRWEAAAGLLAAELAEPVRGVAAGQAAVFYQGDRVIAAGRLTARS